MDVLADRVLALGPKPEANGPYRHFKLTRDGDGIAWLLFDRAGAAGAGFRQDFPPDCVPVRAGEIVRPIDAYVSRVAKRSRNKQAFQGEDT